MDRTQADAIAQAMLEPDLKAQEEVRRKRAQETAKIAAQRRHAGFIVVGYAVGAAVGYFAFGRIVFSGLIGAFAGMLASALVGRLRNRGAA
jgi:hypothetical protein